MATTEDGVRAAIDGIEGQLTVDQVRALGERSERCSAATLRAEPSLIVPGEAVILAHALVVPSDDPAERLRGSRRCYRSRPSASAPVAARREFENWFFFYFKPRERMRAANPVKEVRHIGLMGEELAAFLNTLRAVEPRQLNAVEKALHTVMPNIDGIEVEVSDLGEVELRLKEGGIAMPARVLSEGTLRLLGLLALAGAKEAPALVGFEEPENGIHPRRIQLIAELLRTRARLGRTQYIVTTNSPILPDLMPAESLFVVRRANAETQIDQFSTWGPLGRRPDVEAALEAAQERLSASDRILRGDFDA
jgi:hypothetical protein